MEVLTDHPFSSFRSMVGGYPPCFPKELKFHRVDLPLIIPLPNGDGRDHTAIERVFVESGNDVHGMDIVAFHGEANEKTYHHVLVETLTPYHHNLNCGTFRMLEEAKQAKADLEALVKRACDIITVAKILRNGRCRKNAEAWLKKRDKDNTQLGALCITALEGIDTSRNEYDYSRDFFVSQKYYALVLEVPAPAKPDVGRALQIISRTNKPDGLFFHQERNEKWYLFAAGPQVQSFIAQWIECIPKTIGEWNNGWMLLTDYVSQLPRSSDPARRIVDNAFNSGKYMAIGRVARFNSEDILIRIICGTDCITEFKIEDTKSVFLVINVMKDQFDQFLSTHKITTKSSSLPPLSLLSFLSAFAQ